eukprot:TRINITY_DN747_c0_g1_i1.p1 TRINITY_DN747_c0_g1~~TRINITY_DN747_c0_g1_i1.p1  ORF type:complete len:333 (-),score=66.13 TRINITY_DN747_c0_g1_i1:28-1026(-)
MTKLLILLLLPVVFGWWRPQLGTTFQIQYVGTIDTTLDVDMYNVDLFDTAQSTIDALRASGKIVICYFSAGSYENWRSDAPLFPAKVLGKNLDGWPGEKWLDIRNWTALGPIMTARMDLAVSKKCDGVDPDNVDGYTQDSGFTISYADQIAYNTNFTIEAHARNLSIGLKNDLDQITDLVSHYDWATNEQCFQYQECDRYQPFINQNKAVFGMEYNMQPRQFCPTAYQMNLSFLKKNLNLDAYRYACNTTKPTLTSPIISTSVTSRATLTSATSRATSSNVSSNSASNGSSSSGSNSASSSSVTVVTSIDTLDIESSCYLIVPIVSLIVVML